MSIVQLRALAKRDEPHGGLLTKTAAQIEEAAAFLERMAKRIDDALDISVIADAAADCRREARKLRGEA